MADVQTEYGFSKIANAILDNMARIKLSPTQYRILFVVWRNTYGFNRKEHELALSYIANATGCDKRQLQRELKGLVDRNIIRQKIVNGISRTISFNKDYDEWIGKTTIGEIDNGETDNGGIDVVNNDNGNSTDIGETSDPSIGGIVKGSIGETDNQEIHSLKISLNKEDVVEDLPNQISDVEISNGANEIEKYFCQKRGKGLQVNLEDYKSMKEIVSYGITVQSVKKSIDNCFSEYKPQHPKDEIRSFSYCSARCYDDWLKHLEIEKPNPSKIFDVEGGNNAGKEKSGSNTRGGRAVSSNDSRYSQQDIDKLIQQ